MSDNGHDPATKELETDAIRRSVQALPQSLYEQPRNSFVLHLASAADEIMPWGRNVVFRDRQLRQFWPTEPTLAGAVTSVAATRAAYSFTLDGPPRTVKAAMDLLQNADFGKGLVSLLLKTGIDLLSQDNGAFTEIIREANRPDAAVVGLAHLDAGQCTRTGIPEIPVLYTDPRDGIEHKLKWYQVITWEEMPSPIAVMNNVQYSAVTRVLRAAQILRDIAIYRNEKVAGRRAKAIHFVGGAKRTEIEDARKRMGEEADNEGFVRYMEPIIIASLDPNTPVSVATLDIASLPDGFDMDKEMQWYITQLALGFGGDYLDLAPLPGKGLGSAKESETLSRKSRGKGPAIWMKLVAHKFNYCGILPSTVEWRFDDDDLAVDREKAEIAKTEAETRKIDIESGVLTPQVARQIMADEGKLDEGYLKLLGAQDITTNETLTDTQQTGHEEEINASGQPQTQPIVSNRAPIETKAKDHPGAMLAFMLDENQSALLGSIDGYKPDHLTLIFISADGRSLPKENVSALKTLLRELGKRSAPLYLDVSGYGRFETAEGDGKDAIYASVDSPGLPGFRQELLRLIRLAGIEPVVNHGFSPHITLGYIDSPNSTPQVTLPLVQFRMSSFSLVIAGKRFDFELTGNESYKTNSAPQEGALAKFFRKIITANKTKEVSLKSINQVVNEYDNRLQSLVVDAVNGNIKARAFQRTHEGMIVSFSEMVYKEGMSDCGLNQIEFDEDDSAVIRDWVGGQLKYTDEFAKAAVSASKIENLGERIFARDDLFTRVGMWVRSLRDLGARGCARAKEGELAYWELGHSKTHCADCLRYSYYKPKRMKYWMSQEKLPRSSNLACSGLNCDCKLVSVKTGRVIYP